MLVGIPSMLLVCILISFFAIGWAIVSKTVGEGTLGVGYIRSATGYRSGRSVVCNVCCMYTAL